MNAHSLTKNSALLKLLEFLQAHFLGTDLPLQDDSLNQGNSTSIQSSKRRPNLQPTYNLERRYFL